MSAIAVILIFLALNAVILFFRNKVQSITFFRFSYLLYVAIFAVMTLKYLLGIFTSSAGLMSFFEALETAALGGSILFYFLSIIPLEEKANNSQN